jgi:hypothetical protein
MRITAAAFLLIAAGASAQTDKTTVASLLEEVRQLRLALERSSMLAPKIQLTVQRLTLQEQKVARLSAQLDGVRREVAAQSAGAQRAAQAVSGIEQRMSTETDVVRRKQLEQELAHVKSMATQPVDAQLLARESEVAGALQTERAITQELTDRLAAIERSLDSPPPCTSQAQK